MSPQKVRTKPKNILTWMNGVEVKSKSFILKRERAETLQQNYFKKYNHLNSTIFRNE